MAVHRDALVDIPVVELQSPDAPQQLLEAASLHGFIFVKQKSLALAPDDVDNMFRLSRILFSSPPHIKEECTINSNKSGKNHGWLSMHTETLDPGHQKKGDFKEAFNIGEFVHGKPQQPFPEPLKHEQEKIGKFFDDCHSVCNQILCLLATALQIPEADGGSEWFSQRHDNAKEQSGSILRLLYYPTIPLSTEYDPAEDVRAGAHSDYGSITLLFRLPDQPGLEIKTSWGEWAPVPVDPEGCSTSEPLPILVNIGDLLSFWTNGLFKSTVHRVIFPKPDKDSNHEDRYSIAYFCHPEDSAELVEIPSPIVRDYGNKRETTSMNGSLSRPMTAREHLNNRLAATYGIG